MLQSFAIVGNPRPRSRTREIAEQLAAALDLRPDVLDLADHAARVFDADDQTLRSAQDAAASTDVLILASPTYKATYTGLLKSFLDRFGNRGLAGVTAIPVMAGGDRSHALAIDFAFRPLLVELGASVPTAGLFVSMSELDALESTIEHWVAENGPLVAATARRRGTH